MKKILLLLPGLIISLFFMSCQAQEAPPVRNIILLVGDGMATNQIFAGYTANKGSLELERAQFVGFSKTSSDSDYTTDSGAGATAMSTGKKTYNEAIGMNAKGEKEKTILESAMEAGKSTGLISTSAVTHATPASFVAHNVSRHNYEEIAYDFVQSGIDIFIGGGRDHFEQRTDSLNLSDSLRSKGYSVVHNMKAISRRDRNKIAGLLAPEHLPSILLGRGQYLPVASKLTMERLNENDKGFFLMIEGSQIDWGGHDNDIDYVTSEMIDFDRAVGMAFDFADQNPGTLVIVTGDHETGGLSVTGGDISTGYVEGVFTTTNHTPVMVPVFAYGEGAALFAGIYENTAIYDKMMQLFQLD